MDQSAVIEKVCAVTKETTLDKGNIALIVNNIKGIPNIHIFKPHSSEESPESYLEYFKELCKKYQLDSTVYVSLTALPFTGDIKRPMLEKYLADGAVGIMWKDNEAITMSTTRTTPPEVYAKVTDEYYTDMKQGKCIFYVK